MLSRSSGKGVAVHLCSNSSFQKLSTVVASCGNLSERPTTAIGSSLSSSGPVSAVQGGSAVSDLGPDESKRLSLPSRAAGETSGVTSGAIVHGPRLGHSLEREMVVVVNARIGGGGVGEGPISAT